MLGGSSNSAKCYSSVYTGLNPPLPPVNTEGNIDAGSIRGTLTVVESPNASNGYRLVIELDDNAWGGPAWYEITIEQHWFTPRGQFEWIKTVTVPRWLNEGAINKGAAHMGRGIGAGHRQAKPAAGYSSSSSCWRGSGLLDSM